MFFQQYRKLESQDLPPGYPDLAMDDQCVHLARMAEHQAVNRIMRTVAEKIVGRKNRNVAALPRFERTEIGKAAEIARSIQCRHLQNLFRCHRLGSMHHPGEE